jgi:drug/metabolite transporter (DMT)-like permease
VLLAVLCALVSALLYGMASVLQQRGAAAQPEDQSLRLGLLARLVRDPWWLLGLGCDVGGYVFQFVALGHGPLVLVQPLLVCGLLFALPLGAAVAGRRLLPSDWVAAGMVCAGLAVFLTVARPSAGSNDVGPGVWVLLLTTCAATALFLVLVSRGRGPRLRVVLLSGGAGVLYGAGAALTKTSSHLLDEGWLRLLLHWQPYMLALFGIIGMLLAQSAFQAGWLDVSLPTMSVTDPIVSIVVGALAFGEELASGPLSISVEVVALIVMSMGVVVLARSGARTTVPHPPPVPT